MAPFAAVFGGANTVGKAVFAASLQVEVGGSLSITLEGSEDFSSLTPLSTWTPSFPSGDLRLKQRYYRVKAEQ